MIAMMIVTLTIGAQEDTLSYEGTKIMQHIDNTWVSTDVIETPVFKMVQMNGHQAYLYLRVGNNKPIIDEMVDIITDDTDGEERIIGFSSKMGGPCLLKVYPKLTLGLFYFQPDFHTQTMQSYIIMYKQ